MFSATKFVVAAAIVALFGGFLLYAQPFDQPKGMVPGAASGSEPPPATSVEPPRYTRCTFEYWLACDLEPDSLYGLGIDPIGFSVPSSGWTLSPSNGYGWTIEKGPFIAHPGGWEIASTAITFGLSADGLYADPCTQDRGDPFGPEVRDIGAGRDHRQQRADLAAAVAAVPGIEVVEGPSDFDLPNGFGEVAATYVAVAIPAGPCRVPNGSPLLYDRDTGDPRIRAPLGPRNRVSLWIVDYTGHAGFADKRFWIEAQTASPEMDDEIKAIVATVQPLGG